jgi:hypothetical protein
MPSVRASSSIASFDDNDIEIGDSSHDDIPETVITVSKLMNNGKVPRRRSQCEQLSFRRPSGLSSSGDNDSASWSLQQLLPSSSHSTSSSSPQRKGPSYHLPVMAASSSALLLVAMTIFVVSQQYVQVASLRSQLEIANQSRLYLEKAASDLHSKLTLKETALNHCNRAHSTTTKHNLDQSDAIRTLHQALIESNLKVERLMDRDANVASLMTAERRLRWSEGRWDKYVSGIAQRSHQRVVEKYGKGPHHVELQVQLPPSQGEGGSSIPTVETIKIELAPLDMMPHSIRVFLEQISSGMWDDSAFDLHAGHVFMAHNRGSEESSYDKEEIPMMSFPEFNADYPHDRYTIAFPSPWSTSNQGTSPRRAFYINLQDNSSHHSPRVESFSSGGAGAATPITEERFVEGESCFGTIFDEASRRVVDRMDALSVDDGKRGNLNESVIIKSARVVVYGRLQHVKI